MSVGSFRSHLLCAALLAAAGPAAAQHASAAPALERPGARIAVLDVAMYNAQANVREPDDSAKAVLASEVLRARLAALMPGQLVDSGAVRAAAREPAALEAARGHPCNVIVACARAVGRGTGAAWAVMVKVSKTSNLIWLLTAQLVHAPSGRIVLDDSTELKGEPEAMVRKGARIFAERVTRTVRNGGVANDFPTPT
jgi:hypothetical protein